jgi:hypothetical protein
MTCLSMRPPSKRPKTDIHVEDEAPGKPLKTPIAFQDTLKSRTAPDYFFWGERTTLAKIARLY